MWTNAMKRQRLERLERSKNDSFEWETIVFNFFFKKLKKINISRIWTGQTRRSSRCSRYIRPSVVYVTLWSKFSL